MVGSTSGSREEVPGLRKLAIRDDNANDNENNVR
jgi:hypothetical protein